KLAPATLASPVTIPMLIGVAAGWIRIVAVVPTPLDEISAAPAVETGDGPSFRIPPPMLLLIASALPDSAFAAVVERVCTPATDKAPALTNDPLTGPAISSPVAPLPTAVNCEFTTMAILPLIAPLRLPIVMLEGDELFELVGRSEKVGEPSVRLPFSVKPLSMAMPVL